MEVLRLSITCIAEAAYGAILQGATLDNLEVQCQASQVI